jgi:hypothetical protein
MITAPIQPQKTDGPLASGHPQDFLKSRQPKRAKQHRNAQVAVLLRTD